MTIRFTGDGESRCVYAVRDDGDAFIGHQMLIEQPLPAIKRCRVGMVAEIAQPSPPVVERHVRKMQGIQQRRRTPRLQSPTQKRRTAGVGVHHIHRMFRQKCSQRSH